MVPERSSCHRPSFEGRDGSLGQELCRFGVAQLSHPGRKLSTGFLPLTSVHALAPVDVRKRERCLYKCLLMSNVPLRCEWTGRPSSPGQRSAWTRPRRGAPALESGGQLACAGGNGTGLGALGGLHRVGFLCEELALGAQ